ncbi:hypothetical protein Csa_000144 [Cucumis sativus]|uniref:Uncharacterized protein n=1 Tax=Cucumis sativus TaxID=3659 RepID=A0A0A0KRX4_CUCSA|nr:hypothetical protein Csa_000144 [Cucumis sativus]
MESIAEVQSPNWESLDHYWKRENLQAFCNSMQQADNAATLVLRSSAKMASRHCLNTTSDMCNSSWKMLCRCLLFINVFP